MAVVLSIEQYSQMCQSKTSLVEFFRQAPLVEANFDLTRDRNMPRGVTL